MRILIWHVHGSWTTAFVAGPHDYLFPCCRTAAPTVGAGPARGAGRRRLARCRRTQLRDERARRRRAAAAARGGPGRAVDRPPPGPRPARRLPRAQRSHRAAVSTCTRSPPTRPCAASPSCTSPLQRDGLGLRRARRRRVIEHGIPDPGHSYTGDVASLAVVVNEPVRRWRVAGTDLLLGMARPCRCEVYGMGDERRVADRAARARRALHDDLPQAELHDGSPGTAPTSTPTAGPASGCRCMEAMTLGMPVLALSTTEAPEAVPPEAGAGHARPRRAARDRPPLARRPGRGPRTRPGGPAARARPLRPLPVPRRLGPLLEGGDPMKIAMVSEHASPLAALGGVDAGGQNVHVAALARALGPAGHEVEVYTRRDDPGLPERVRARAGAPPWCTSRRPARARAPGTTSTRSWPAFGRWMAGDWAAPGRPDVVHAHFWMSGAGRARGRRGDGHPGGADLPRARHGQAAASGRRGHQPPPSGWTASASWPRASTWSSRPARTRCASWPWARRGTGDGRAVRCRHGALRAGPPWPGPRAPDRPPRSSPSGRLVQRKGVDTVSAPWPPCRVWSWSSPAARRARSWPGTPRRAGCGRWPRSSGWPTGSGCSAGWPHARMPALYRSADVVALHALVRAVRDHAAGGGGLRRAGGGQRGGRPAGHRRGGGTGVLVPPRDPAAVADAVATLRRPRARAAARASRAPRAVAALRLGLGRRGDRGAPERGGLTGPCRRPAQVAAARDRPARVSDA